MKEHIPTEEDIDLLIAALASHEKYAVSELLLDAISRNMGGLNGLDELTDEEAFIKAFSKKDEKELAAQLKAEATRLRDRTLVLSAKLINFRDAVRQYQVTGEIDRLLN